MLTTPALFAMANGIDAAGGLHRCFYCAAPCSDKCCSADYVLSSFTAHSTVAAHGSPHVCAGCVLTMETGREFTSHEGALRSGRAAQPRLFSWVITATKSTACTKASLAFLRDSCLDPPEPPFSIVLSESGQTHQLYRGVVCMQRDHVAVTLEGDVIDYDPCSLAQRMELCGKIIAATGKPAIEADLRQNQLLDVADRSGIETLEEWMRVASEPLTRLAAWLSPGKEECLALYPATTQQA